MSNSKTNEEKLKERKLEEYVRQRDIAAAAHIDQSMEKRLRRKIHGEKNPTETESSYDEFTY